MSNLREAAERLRNAEASGINYHDIYGMGDEHDRRVLSEAWLALHDPTPITSVTLEGAGFGQVPKAWAGRLGCGPLQTWMFHDSGGSYRQWFYAPANALLPEYLHPATLGELRWLLEKLKEQA